MRQVWTTVIIALNWIAATFTLLTQDVDVFIVFSLTLAATIFLIVFGLQRVKE